MLSPFRCITFFGISQLGRPKFCYLLNQFLKFNNITQGTEKNLTGSIATFSPLLVFTFGIHSKVIVVAIYSDPNICWVLYSFLFNFSQQYKLKIIISTFQIQMIINLHYIHNHTRYISQGSLEEQNQLEREKKRETYKELTHVIVEADKSKIFRVSGHAGGPGKSCSSSPEFFFFFFKGVQSFSVV